MALFSDALGLAKLLCVGENKKEHNESIHAGCTLMSDATLRILQEQPYASVIDTYTLGDSKFSMVIGNILSLWAPWRQEFLSLYFYIFSVYGSAQYIVGT